jgi:hypothetical protein
MTVENDPDQLETQGQKLRDLGEEIDTAVKAMEEKAQGLQACFGNGEIGRIMQEHHVEVLATALDVYYMAAFEIQSSGDDLKFFADQWRDADDAAATDFGRIGTEIGGE